MSDIVPVSSGLVRYLRRGVRFQFGCAAERLAKCLLESDNNPAEYERSLQIFQSAHALYDQVKSVDDQPPLDIEIDVASNGQLVLEALECQYNAELDLLHEGEFYGGKRDAVCENVRALGDLLRIVKKHLDQSELDKTESFPLRPHLVAAADRISARLGCRRDDEIASRE